MKFVEALQELAKGKKIKHISWKDNKFVYIDEDGFVCIEEDRWSRQVKEFINSMFTIDDLNRDGWELYGETILTNSERKYILNVIQPYKDRVRYISKELVKSGNFFFIRIVLDGFAKYSTNIETIELPYFDEDEKFRYMVTSKPYTLKELGML